MYNIYKQGNPETEECGQWIKVATVITNPQKKIKELKEEEWGRYKFESHK